jgi:predicted metal-binding transcription factor (methanogenesis marker protein 9)
MSGKLSPAEKVKLLDEARLKMLKKIEQARQEYLEVKRQLYPELFAPPPAEATRIIEEQQKRIKELEEYIKELEEKLALKEGKK